MCSIIQNVVIQTIIYDKCAWYPGNFLCNCIFFFFFTYTYFCNNTFAHNVNKLFTEHVPVLNVFGSHSMLPR